MPIRRTCRARRMLSAADIKDRSELLEKRTAMKKTAYFLLLNLLCMASFAFIKAGASDGYVKLLPFVTKEMTKASYWSKKEPDADRLLADSYDIQRMNENAFGVENTKLCDLNNQPKSFNGETFNANLRQRLQKNADQLLGRTYTRSGHKTDAAFFEAMIDNAINPEVSHKRVPFKYAVVTSRSELRAYPSGEAILDAPNDLDLDYQYYDSLRVNEPLLIYTYSNDRNWCFARSLCFRGWVRCSDIAVCRSREEWLQAWDIPEERTLVVYGSKVILEASNYAPEITGKLLTIGTKLELAGSGADELVDNRSEYNNYAVYLPVRLKDGSYAKKKVLISEHSKVHVGYLRLTKTNIAKVAFEVLGDVYGWGGMLLSDDCSGLARNTYRCFGLELGHNSTCQAAMPVKGYDLSGLSDAEKYRIIQDLPLGSILYFKGHEMLYLGHENGHYYVINALSAMLDSSGRSKKKIGSVVINTLDVRRPNGKTWISELSYANIPYHER